MKRIAGLSAMVIGLALVSEGQVRQEIWRQACIQRCETSQPVDVELQRQEIVSLEREAARAIQLNNGTFFRRVYSDDFTGTLSHGQPVDRSAWLAVVESPAVKFESFHASDIKVRVFQDTAIATCLWSARGITAKGQRVSSQLRAIHVYVNSPRGWHVVSGQATNLPPDVQQPL
jgi:ketosteroid isomerase-like protein